MKFASLSLLAAASLVAASPIRIVVVSNQAARPLPDAMAHIRVGFAAANPNLALVKPTELVEEPAVIPSSPVAEEDKPRIHCSGGKGIHSAAVHIANIFRQTLGLPLIEDPKQPHGEIMPPTEPAAPGEVHIMPFVEPPRPTSEELQAVPYGTPTPSNADPQDPTWVRGNGRHPHRQHFRHGRYRSFVFRLNRAFMALGPWESYAVGFVFGCGLGSLARMIYVLAIVFSRAVARRRAQQGAVRLAEAGQGQSVAVAPAQYVDEKSQPPAYATSTN
ncbi:hypothetical protein BOTBODRAFT_25677 [Botryobasidium botryosum FD-172 SS1]|uniref:Copper transporter n=1 Tax=Botryobasidium botryosum (strain FD-172 SS1) TaxID=930990 RepID=A0A067NAV6_BOTB1|nr:hypothetical protein BOTBODRAFT_25677 [Botryobasidium botryosum FD-172 SS1]